MTNGWATTTLGEVCGFQNGFAFKSSRFKQAGCPILRISNIQDDRVDVEKLVFFDPKDYRENLDRYRIIQNDLLIAMSGATTGKLGFNTENAVFYLNQRVGKFEPGKNLSKRFLYYFLSTKVEENLRISAGAAQPNLSTEQIKGFVLPYPPLPEQRRIVGILDEAFDGIATAKANAEKNLQNARALFESHLNAVFTQRGDGWMMERIGTLTELARGHNLPKSTFSPKPKKGYVRFYQIRDGSTDDYAVYVPDTPQLHKMKKDDIMMVAYRHVGRAFRGVEGAFNVALCKISNACRDLLDDDYLFHLIPSPFVKGELLKRSERWLIPSMSIHHLRELQIPLPPLPEQQRIVELIKRLSTESQRLESLYQRKLAALDELKKSLLHQAFSGQLTGGAACQEVAG